MRVTYIQAAMFHYSVPFLERARAGLENHGVEFEVVFGQPSRSEILKGGAGHVPWEKRVQNTYFTIGHHELVWQPVLRDIWSTDLAIVCQENRRLVNYVAQLGGPLRPSKLAFWGHGRNHQSDLTTLRERWKQLWATRCDWWFTYTEETGKLIERYGYPRERITVVHNSIDTNEIRRWAAEITAEERAALAESAGVKDCRVAVYVGGLYREKRIPFLLEAGRLVHDRMPDFRLLVVGGGEEQGLVEEAARTTDWVKFAGAKFGREKVALLSLGRAFAMPGLVGLGILDCSVLGIPLVTTAFPYHSPEIAYLEADKSGLLVEDWQNPEAYAAALASVLGDGALQQRLGEAAQQVASRFTVENMANCFVEGVVRCLETPRRR